MLERVRRYIDTHHLIPPKASILVGVSGGVDSMVLLHLLHALEYQVTSAHMNYRMRGPASDGDQQLVESRCRALGIPCVVHTVSDAFLSTAGEGSFQEKARTERYAFFERTARETGIGYIAVAHHLDDQAETVLMHLMRGSGIEGLAGMAPCRMLTPHSDLHLVRPLLDITREEIETYANESGLSSRSDVSNSDTRYLRNAIRHGVLAHIESAHGKGAVRNIGRSAAHLQGYVESTIKPALETHFKAATVPEAGLNVAVLREMQRVWQERVILEALRKWLPEADSHNAVVAVSRLIDAQVGRRVVFGAGAVWRDRSALRFVPSDAAPDASVLQSEFLVPGPGNVVYGNATLEVSLLSVDEISDFKTTPDVLLADAGKARFPLILRRWRPGDRFQPFGMKGQKKVSDFLTDNKVAPQQREDVWVLTVEDEIVWIVGHRAAATIKIEQQTSQVLRCKMVRR